MGKNFPAKIKKTHAKVPEIVKVQNQRIKLQSYIDEAVKSKMKILDEQQNIKSIREAAVEELNIQPKLFNGLVSMHFNNNFDQKKEEYEDMIDAIDAVVVSVENNK